MSGLVAVVVTRMGSGRLPGKAMLPILGQPLLAHLLQRIRHSRHVGRIVVATTTASRDDPIAELVGGSQDRDLACYRGSEEDVLGRLHEALRAHPAAGALQLLGDNPLLHCDQIDAVCERFLAGGVDYAVSAAPELPGLPVAMRRFPVGVRAEAFAPRVIEECARRAVDPYHREHATSFIHHHPDSFRIAYVEAPAELAAPPGLRLDLAVNYRRNYELVRIVFERLYPRQPNFPLAAVASLIASEPRLAELMGPPVETNVAS